ncbi:MAG: hypothetical protein V3R67_08925 [Thermodesulfobacteriota bacterium]
MTNLYHKFKVRSTVDFDLSWLHEFAKCKKFDRLFSEWEKSGYRKEFKPSIDRILNSKGYEKKNVQWLTWSENRYKQTMERRCRKGPVIQMQGDKVIKRYKSQRYAVMETGLSQSNMSSCLNGKRVTCGGYNWVFEREVIGNIYEVTND